MNNSNNRSAFSILFLFALVLSSFVLSIIPLTIGFFLNVDIPFSYYYIASMVVAYISYKIRFKTITTFKFFLFRRLLKMNIFFKKVDKKIYINNGGIKLTILQEKSIQLWKTLLKNSQSKISSSISSVERQIQKDNILVTLKLYSNQEFLMSVYFGENCYYEVYIPNSYVEEVCALFDAQLERRMKGQENQKKSSIHLILDKIILEQEKIN